MSIEQTNLTRKEIVAAMGAGYNLEQSSKERRAVIDQIIANSRVATVREDVSQVLNRTH